MKTNPFQTQLYTGSLEQWDCAAAGTVHFEQERVEQILPGATGLTLFPYLFRRFGPSPYGHDDHKKLAGPYFLTTPMEGVVLYLNLGADEGYLNFGYGLSPAIGKQLHDAQYQHAIRWMRALRRSFHGTDSEDDIRVVEFIHNALHPRILSYSGEKDSDHPQPDYNLNERSLEWFLGLRPVTQVMARRIVAEHKLREGERPYPEFRNAQWRAIIGGIKWALHIAMADLLRPVYVRDVPINACGRLTDAQAATLPDDAPHSPLAGYGIATDVMQEFDSWHKVHTRLQELATENGSMAAGLKQALALLNHPLVLFTP